MKALMITVEETADGIAMHCDIVPGKCSTELETVALSRLRPFLVEWMKAVGGGTKFFGTKAEMDQYRNLKKN